MPKFFLPVVIKIKSTSTFPQLMQFLMSEGVGLTDIQTSTVSPKIT